MVAKKIPTIFEKIELALKIFTFIAVAAGGGWAIYQYRLTGADDWVNNIRLETAVLPYHDNLRLLVVHVKTKNPRNYVFELDPKLGDSFELRVRKVATDANEGHVISEEEGKLIQKVELMPKDGEQYEYLPGAEMDGMRTIVLPAGTIVTLTAEMDVHNGTKDKNGKPETVSRKRTTYLPQPLFELIRRALSARLML